MALDATAGGTSSNSYATVAEADAYVLLNAFNTVWAAANNTAKENALMWATALLDALDFPGVKSVYTSALRWPRWGVEDRDLSVGPSVFGLQGIRYAGYIDSTTIPLFLKRATAEYANRLLSDDWTEGLGPIVTFDAGVGSLKVASMAHKPIPSSVMALLGPYTLGGPNNSSRMVRG